MRPAQGARRVLAIGAHPDDIELGCGASLAVHRARGDEISLLVLTGGERGADQDATRRREQEEAAALLDATLLWGGLRDGYVTEDAETVRVIESVLATTGADIVYTHAVRDTHQDHRAAARATLAATRSHTQVLCYEAPTSESFTPALYIDVNGYVEAKLDLVRAHLSEVLRAGVVDVEAIEARARHRGFEGRVRYAEAFEIGRFVLDLRPDTIDLTADLLTQHHLSSRKDVTS